MKIFLIVVAALFVLLAVFLSVNLLMGELDDSITHF
jgi:hypothetical protein